MKTSDKKRKKRKTSVKSKIMSLGICLVISMLSISILSIYANYQTQQKYNALLTEISVTNQIMESITDAMADIDTYLLYDDQRGQLDLNKRINDIKILLDQLEIKETGHFNLLESFRERVKNVKGLIEDKELGEAVFEKDKAKDIAGFLNDAMQDRIFELVKQAETVKTQVANEFLRTIIISSIVLAVILGGAIIMMISIANRITVPLRQVCTQADEIRKGNLTVKPLNVKTHDEIKDLSESFNNMIENIRNSIKKVQDISNKVHTSANQFLKIADENNKAGQEIAGSVENMAQGIHVQSEEAGHITDNIKNIHDLSSQIEKNDEKIISRANQSVQLAEDGTQSIHEFAEQMNKINETINVTANVTKQLDESSKEMNGILEVMASISTQTNLLSLNASIEAARAGEAGKGFAVVAEEIRKLAADSASFNEQIGNLINNLQVELAGMLEQMDENIKHIEQGTIIANKVRDQFESIKDANLVVDQDIKASTKELTNLNHLVRDVDHSIEQNNQVIRENEMASGNISATVEEQTANLQELASSAEVLNQLAEDMDDVVNLFKLN